MSKINGIKGDRWRYKPGQNKVFPISRSKFGEYLKCKRCFYLNTIKGLKSPSMPGWPLNSATDRFFCFLSWAIDARPNKHNKIFYLKGKNP